MKNILVYTCDKNIKYATKTINAINSAIVSGVDADIVLLMQERNRAFGQSIFEGVFKGTDVKVVYLDDDCGMSEIKYFAKDAKDVEQLKKAYPKRRVYPIETAYRLLVFKLDMFKDYDKVAIIDGDTEIVDGKKFNLLLNEEDFDIAWVAESDYYDFGKRHISRLKGVLKNIAENNENCNQYLDISNKDPQGYYNVGMGIYNFKRMRDTGKIEKIFDTCMNLLEKKMTVKFFGEQDMLNICVMLYDDILVKNLDLCYNRLHVNKGDTQCVNHYVSQQKYKYKYLIRDSVK